MRKASQFVKNPRFILYIDKEDPQPDLLTLLMERGFEVEVLCRSQEPGEGTVLPWLVTPYGNFYGKEGIKGFIDYEPKIAEARAR